MCSMYQKNYFSIYFHYFILNNMRMSSPDHHKSQDALEMKVKLQRFLIGSCLVPGRFWSVPARFWWVHVLVTANIIYRDNVVYIRPQRESKPILDFISIYKDYIYTQYIYSYQVYTFKMCPKE